MPSDCFLDCFSPPEELEPNPDIGGTGVYERSGSTFRHLLTSPGTDWIHWDRLVRRSSPRSVLLSRLRSHTQPVLEPEGLKTNQDWAGRIQLQAKLCR